jgi:hypothetical protein
MLPGAEGRQPPAGPGSEAPVPAGLPGIAGNGPMWSILPAGLGRVASGTLLPVIGPPTRTPTPTWRRRLLERFVGARAQYVFVGPRTGLRGPAKVVMALANHDDHLHVRVRPGSRR